jgi:hypothetical protein
MRFTRSVWALALTLTCLTASVNAKAFESPDAFYESLGRPIFSQTRKLKALPDGGRPYQSFQLGDTVLRFGKSELILQRRRIQLASLARLDRFTFAQLRTLDAPTAEAYFNGDRRLLCVEWPLGHSGSASRWKGVMVMSIDKPRRPPLAFAGPYAGCSSIVWPHDDRANESLAWGVFDIRFESAHEAQGGFFALRQLQPDAKLLKRFQIRYPDSSELLKFEAAEF